jgi:hypothetical protein
MGAALFEKFSILSPERALARFHGFYWKLGSIPLHHNHDWLGFSRAHVVATRDDRAGKCGKISNLPIGKPKRRKEGCLRAQEALP